MPASRPQFGVSYYGNRFPRHAREDVSRIAAVCDYVVHTVSEADLTYHKSVLATIFADTRRLGLEVWADPWSLGGVFGGEALSSFLTAHRDSWQVMSSGQIRPHACLNRPEWRDFVKEWVLSVRDMGAQVIFWDEPHISFDFESEWNGIFSCFCAYCQLLFKKKYGMTMPHRLDDSTRAFRIESMRDFLNDMMSFARSKSLRNALCLYAFRGHKQYDMLWAEAASLPHLDIFGCDPYWRWHGKHKPDVRVGEFSKYVVETAKPHGKQTQVWIQAMRLAAGFEKEIDHAVDAAVAAGVTHIAAWGFDGGELLDTVLSENPAEVWRAVERSFARYRS